MTKNVYKKFSIPYFLLTSFLLVSLANLCTFAEVFVVKDDMDFGAAVGLVAVSFLVGFVMPGAAKSFQAQMGYAVYLPVCVPFLSGLLMQMFLPDEGLGWDLMAIFFFTNQYMVMLLGKVGWALSNLAAVLVFGVGERLSNRRKKTQRRLPSVRSVVVVFCVFAVIWGMGKYHQYVKELSTVTFRFGGEGDGTTQDEDSYGFPFERGWSSTDLRPYYVEMSNNKLAKLDGKPTFTIAEQGKMPVLDGAEAAYPVYSAFAYACYEGIAEIQRKAKAEGRYQDAPIQFTNTIEAYKKLLSGDVDIFFGARPSKEQEQLAEEAGKKILLTPIAKEGFVFFVNKENKVSELTSEQIRAIYSGKITNWWQVGGSNMPILAFQRPENSGSQTMMQYFMGDVPLKPHLKSEYKDSMVGVLEEVADGYENKKSSIGYSFRYFATQMTENEGVKFLAVDGVYPDEESIRTGAYPMTTQLYAITVEGNENEYIVPFLEFMQGEQGRELVGKTGYVAE